MHFKGEKGKDFFSRCFSSVMVLSFHSHISVTPAGTDTSEITSTIGDRGKGLETARQLEIIFFEMYCRS